MKEHLIKKLPILFPEISFDNVTQPPLDPDVKKSAVEIANRQRVLIEPLGQQYRFLNTTICSKRQVENSIQNG